jgi:hypothetical protein
MRIRLLPAMLAVLALQGLGACENGSPVDTSLPTTVAVVDGNGQKVLAGDPLPAPLRVRVTDGDGQPMAGAPVQWWATAGTFSAAETVTDASGIASVTWIMRTTPNSAPLGAQRATGTVAGAGSAEFSGYSGRGITVGSVSITAPEVNVASGPATVTVSVRATDDISDVFEGAFRFTSPSGASTAFPRLTLASGTGIDGVWQGTVEIPQGAEPGLWKLQVTLRSHRYTVTWFSETLQGQGLAHGVTVRADP